MKQQLSSNYRNKRYLKYAPGGTLLSDDDTGNNSVSGIVGGVAPIAAGLLDAFDSGNQFGRQHVGTSAVKGALSGAAAGTALGPIGIAGGAILGTLSGLIGGNKARRTEREMLYAQSVRNGQIERDSMASQIAANPSLIEGYRNAQYFKTGGKMVNPIANQYTTGGNLTSVSSDGMEANGQSHSNGGIKIPVMNAEVEGGETIKDDYVFSKELGFAQLHKPIMRAKGKIEKKPFTVDRINAINLLNEQENQLMLLQEYKKRTLGL